MVITEVSAATRRRAPMPGGPTAAALTPAGVSGQLAAVHVEIRRRRYARTRPRRFGRSC